MSHGPNLFGNIEMLWEFDFSASHILSVALSTAVIWAIAMFCGTLGSTFFPALSGPNTTLDLTPLLQTAAIMGMVGALFGGVLTLILTFIFHRIAAATGGDCPVAVTYFPCLITGMLFGTAIQFFLLPILIRPPYSELPLAAQLFIIVFVSFIASTRSHMELVKRL